MRHSKVDAILELIDGALAGSSHEPDRAVAVGPQANRNGRPARPDRPRTAR